VSTRDIRTSTKHITCDVCGRNLLRGEHAERYVAGTQRYWVCDLCVSRALEDGWVREGTLPAYEPEHDGRERRRPLLPRLRARLGSLRSEDDGQQDKDDRELGYPVYRAARSPLARVRAPEAVREPRHVHAVPSSAEQKVAEAIRAFNGSEHTRTIAGVARSLGPPAVSVIPSELEASVVRLVAAWELCWYRYEIDLADELPSVRLAGQGSELGELEEAELQANAGADEDGGVALRG
jgi:hypothetical protein